MVREPVRSLSGKLHDYNPLRPTAPRHNQRRKHFQAMNCQEKSLDSRRPTTPTATSTQRNTYRQHHEAPQTPHTTPKMCERMTTYYT